MIQTIALHWKNNTSSRIISMVFNIAVKCDRTLVVVISKSEAGCRMANFVSPIYNTYNVFIIFKHCKLT